MKNNEARLEEDKKALRCNLDDAENRVTKGELARRSLEGDLQRMKLALTDKETENQVGKMMNQFDYRFYSGLLARNGFSW